MSAAGPITDTASLLAALDGRGDSVEERRAFDERVWQSNGQKGAVLVTDLAGFTRLTKKHGILHFLHVFRRCEHACLHQIPKHKGELMKHEADDLIALFPTTADAISAALDMQRATHAMNVSLADDDQVHLCVGVEWGTLLRLSDDAFGDPVNVAFKLGEDVAKAGEVLIGQNAWREATAVAYDFAGCLVDGPRVVEAGDVPLEHYALRVG